MNVLFLSLIDFDTIDEHNIYTDLLREFWKDGHKLYVISPVERRTGRKGGLVLTDKATIAKPRIFDMQKVGYLQKAFSMLTIETILTKTVRRYFSDVKFDLVLYATPPISFERPVRYVKKRDGATTYLLQKDIFPEGLLDLQVLTEHGWKGLVYRYYRRKEVKLLKASDRIGCMSPANVDYIRSHNPFIEPDNVEICPNSIEIVDKSVSAETRREIRLKYEIPLDRMVFVYGGNLGKPQGIPFLIDCLEACRDTGAYFLIVGDGTEYHLIDEYMRKHNPTNARLLKRLPKDDYDNMVGACDVGLIFLDHRFTIPNFPSRLLSYMQANLPVLAATDPNTDIGRIIEENEFGWWCESNDKEKFREAVVNAIGKQRLEYRQNAYRVLGVKYDVSDAYLTIASHLGEL